MRTVVLDDKRGCGYCHNSTETDGNFDIGKILASAGSNPQQAAPRFIAPVSMRTRFLPQARFDHSKHIPVACEGCHDARHVESSGTVMIPGIDNCRGCHGSENASLSAGSTCISCHGFHRNEFGPMRTNPAVKQQAAAAADRDSPK